MDCELDGCINDTECIMKVITDRYGYTVDDIKLINEEPGNTPPTKGNILAGMKWLVDGCMPGDALMMHYSGHGVQRKDQDGDSLTGLDDALVCLLCVCKIGPPL